MKKTALVTGGTSGIGLATALSLHNDHGYDVWVLSRRDFQMDGLRHVRCDVSKENEVTKAVEQIMLEAGRLDLVVNCAGMGISGALEFTDEEDARYLFNVNFFAPVELLRLLVKKKKLEKESSVVFVSSIGGIGSFSLGNGVYGASKAAINSTMKFCARELATKKIRVNTVNPGMVNTKLIQGGAISEE
ncbi:MAG: SDR family NAD(P)-dependent oxidoreductase, partial [Erysipelotrichaceae bacterium]|nr:SDR family NAD(P)-dependent oxidoreductase [Erysipelotrichaceae bacterium]